MHIPHLAPVANLPFTTPAQITTGDVLDPRRRPGLRMLRYGRGHDTLQLRADQIIGDRCPGDARPLPPRPEVRVGQSERLEGIDREPAEAPPHYDPPLWARSLWEDARPGVGRRGRSVLRAAEGEDGDLQAELGQPEGARAILFLVDEPVEHHAGDDPYVNRINTACLIMALLGFAMIFIQIGRTAVAGGL